MRFWIYATVTEGLGHREVLVLAEHDGEYEEVSSALRIHGADPAPPGIAVDETYQVRVQAHPGSAAVAAKCWQAEGGDYSFLLGAPLVQPVPVASKPPAEEKEVKPPKSFDSEDLAKKRVEKEIAEREKREATETREREDRERRERVAQEEHDRLERLREEEREAREEEERLAQEKCEGEEREAAEARLREEQEAREARESEEAVEREAREATEREAQETSEREEREAREQQERDEAEAREQQERDEAEAREQREAAEGEAQEAREEEEREAREATETDSFTGSATEKKEGIHVMKTVDGEPTILEQEGGEG